MNRTTLVAALLFCGAVFPTAAQLRISEFMAGNGHTLADEDGAFEDWIEIQNFTGTNVNVGGWYLTDSASDPTRWRFPATNLHAGGTLVVFASNKDRAVAGGRLHTNFRLGVEGEYLALVRPDGVSVATAFAPAYPRQFTDVSYGFGTEITNFNLVGVGAVARVQVPSSDAAGTLWTLPGFADGDWLAGPTGLGFETGAVDPAEDLYSTLVASSAPLGWWRLDESGGTVATNRGSLGATAAGSYQGSPTLAQAGPRPPAQGGFEVGNLAVRLNGTSARLQVPDVGAFDFGTGPFTIALWFNPANAATRGDLFTYKAAGNDFGIHLASQTANTVSVYHNAFIGTGGAVVNNQWHHLVVTRDASSRVVAYLNGTVIINGTDTGSMNIANDLLFGSNHGGTPSSPSTFFNGAIDEAAIYGRALSAAEVALHYQTATGAGVSYAGSVATDLRTAMHQVNSSVHVRIPFVVADVARVNRLRLRMKYDDGFVAYLNGQPIVAANAPESPAWNSAATNRHADSAALVFEDFDVSDAQGVLRTGTNVLAIHGLNIAASNPDFLLVPELVATTIGGASAEPRYFQLPSPGGDNGLGTKDLGPVIGGVSHLPALPDRLRDQDDLVVTARVAPAFTPVAGVTLRWRVMFGVTNSTPMLDDGLHGDGLAGDGIYGASIPAASSTPGQLVRYYVVATDTAGRASRWPLFEDPLGSPEYLGTVVANPAVTSQLGIWEWFALDTAAARTTTGTRGAVFYNGVLYDNIVIRRRGAATTQGQKFDFNPGFRITLSPELSNLDEVNINNEASDPSFIRPPMAWETFRVAGNPACHSFNLLLRVNGAADRVGIFVEQVDERFLERNGMDPEGALYKFIQRAALTPIFTEPNDGVEKKTRLTEDRSDLAALCAALATTNPAASRFAFLMDNLDLPTLMTHLACRSMIMDSDDVRKNIYMYRDTRGSREWRILPWDKDWSFGILGDGGTFLTHPFFGDEAHAKQNANQWNLLYNAVFTEPKLNQMYLRRLRTVLDRQLQPLGTPQAGSYFEQRAAYWFTPAFPHLGTGPSNAVFGTSGSILSFVPGRRTDLYITFAATNTAATAANRLVPLPQPADVAVRIAAIEYNPASGRQGEEYLMLTNPNPFAVDVSGWRLEGGVRHVFRPGTVIRSNDVMYVSPDVVAFRARTTAPRAGQGLFVQGNYEGQLSARGESLSLLDDTGRLVHTSGYPGTPGPAQLYLRVTELMYHPAPLPGNTNSPEAFEYVELRNIGPVTLDLAGVRFLNGIEFNFSGGAVTSLAPGERVVVVKNLAAFIARYGGGLPVAGEFTGQLDNSGERIQLVDAAGEEILDFTFNNAWYPITDGLGLSLVIVDDTAPWDSWGRKSSWRASGFSDGSPGGIDPLPSPAAPVVIEEALTASAPPAGDWIELHNPSAVPAPVGGWYLTDDFYVPRKFRLAEGTVIPPGGFLVIPENEFGAGVDGFSLNSAGDDLWLIAADAAGRLTGYYHGFDFGAAAPGVSLGRHVNSEGREFFVPQSASTPGATNAGPRVGPVVVGEIMYQPGDAGPADEARLEFIELQNVTGTTVPLFDPAAPTNTWHLRNAVDFDLPPGLSLPPAGRLLVVGFNPVTDSAALDAFRSVYEVDPGTVILGPWEGRLDNGGDAVELKQPVLSAAGDVLRVLVERIEFQPSAPWPAGAAGPGSSLQRIAPGSFGNDPTNWFAAGITPGRSNRFNLNPSITLLAPLADSVFVQPTNILLAARPVDPDGTIVRVEYFSDGIKVGDATEAPFSFVWSGAPFGRHVITARAKDDLLGVAVTAPVSIQVISQPPQVALTAPADGTIVGAGSSVTLTAAASDADGSVTNVVFQVDGAPVGGDAAAPYSLGWTATPGAHRLTVMAVDNSGTSATSAPVNIYVAALLNTNLVLVASNSVWRYLETNATPDPAWITAAYDDRGWKSGPGQLGFGDNDEATRVTNLVVNLGVTNRVYTHYFRREFTVDSLVGITNVLLRVLRDDGAVAYLNGVEVFRSNMATGRVSHTNLAVASVSGLEENTFFPTNLPVSVVRLGANLLAVEVHQQTINNVDLSFAAEVLLQRSVIGPAILAQPSGLTNPPGSTATFAVVASGGEPLGYQWLFNGLPLGGATGTSLVLPAVEPSQAGDYSVVVSNLAGAVTSAVARLVVTPADRDGDGLSDDWELANGTNPDLADADTDLDGDGLTNRQEFVAGTRPNDATSVLRIGTIDLAGGGTAAVVTFNAVAAHSYSLLSRPGVAGAPWLKVADVPPVPVSGPVSVTNATSGAAERFYRVVTPAQP